MPSELDNFNSQCAKMREIKVTEFDSLKFKAYKKLMGLKLKI